MSHRNEEVRPPLRAGGGDNAKSRVRIGRACDRCKVKKSKCDGNTPCSTCLASDTSCQYSARRRREARDWYWGMQDVIDEALQRLYWACRQGRGFPGVVPDDSSGRVSTDDILRGLGLSPPQVDNAQANGGSSDSVLENQARLLALPSYHPPDVQSKPSAPLRAQTMSSALTPISSTGDDRLMFGDGIPETKRTRRKTSTMEVDEDDEDMTDTIPDSDSLDHGFQDGLSAGVGISMMQDGDAGLLYPGMGSLPYGSGIPLGAHGPQTSMQHMSSQFQAQMMEQDHMGSSQTHKAGGMLAWPGSLSRMTSSRRAGPGSSNERYDRGSDRDVDGR